MKFAAVLSYVLVACAASSVAAASEPGLLARDPQRGFGRQGSGRGGFGGFGGGNANASNTNNNANKAGNTAATSTAAAATDATTSTDTAAAAASSSAATTNTGASNSNPQDSLTLDPAVIATGFAQDGQATAEAGQVPSLTTKNNFINFCLTTNKPITNGLQITTGSCNPAPMGVIAGTGNMPSSKFVFPPNGATIAANQAFTIQMAINNIETGNFVNAQANYYSAPQQVNSAGNIIGHTHVVIEALTSLDQTTTTNPVKFAFFKGINGAAVNGIVTADVTAGLPAGVYRMASINAAANHQPVLVAVAQHGSLDDMVYFTVSDNGAASNSTAATAASAATASTAAAASGTAAATASTAAAASGTAATTTTGKTGTGATGKSTQGGNKSAKGGRFRFARDLH